jgi:PTH2 family peptidyl-tRNA hydrolase
MNNPNRSKLAIIVRKDLKMHKGKLMAQASHAVLGVILAQGSYSTCFGHQKYFNLQLKNALQDWLENAFTKVALAVNSDEELLEYKKKAEDAGLPCKLITDCGYTVFNGIPTNTCLAIGPAWNEEIDAICSDLKLY